MEYQTRFGSLSDYDKGGVTIIDDNPKNYVFSNIFEVAETSAPYERVAVAKNFEYVIEVARAEGTSGWYTCAHDEFVLSMDGQVEVHLVKPETALLDAEAQGAHALDDLPDGRKMGRLILGKGHQGLLPAGSAYRFHADQPVCLMIQTIEGLVTVQKWATICQTEA
ncbi:hydroxyquinol 1,2-dioxygenase [Sphingomonas fuzhouensis]|uniref:hydroxyquinol 1,2-dioxygenase n=1 Tax=Sphingomonas fuzhouensis TaxID=3106033 RepID=UPI002AFDF8F3|nr:hydroxyquinol 1,2-dioxygenase [Sphingomonas sp. SGZ-02]